MSVTFGPIRKEAAQLRFSARGKEVLVEHMHDPDDRLEALVRGVIPKKLELLSLQLHCLGAGQEESEAMLRRLATLEGFRLSEISEHLDIISRYVGNFSDPLAVVDAVTANVTKNQPDARHALAMAMALYRDFALLGNAEEEKNFVAILKGN
ncbi:MAG: hypothetical protein AB1324_08230 [Candidatus Micrarchaeota archaeon]